MKPYVYQPLTEPGAFRLLELERNDDYAAPVRGRLKTTSLGSEPEYEALSYCWGERTEDEPLVYIDNRVLRVTKNLHAALIHLRLRNTPIWCDAICINQDNTAERTQQVRQMRQIFAGASLVIAWLGEATDADIDGFEFADNLVSEFQQFVRGKEELQRYGPQLVGVEYAELNQHNDEFRSHYESIYLDSADSFVLHGLCAYSCVFQKDFFLRAWIIQEVIVPKHVTVKCGKAEMAWERFHSAQQLFGLMRLINYTQANSRPFVSNWSAMYVLGFWRREVHLLGGDTMDDLLVALSFAGHSKATDARDKVFALIGIIDPAGVPPGLEPDYDVGNTASRIYHCIAVHYLQDQNPWVLAMVRSCPDCPSYGVLDITSWTPDWRQLACETAKVTVCLNFGFGFRAAGDSECAFRVSSDRKALTVRGRMFGAISALGDYEIWAPDKSCYVWRAEEVDTLQDDHAGMEKAIQDDQDRATLHMNYFKSLYTYTQEAYSMQTRYITGQALQEAIWRTLCCDRDYIRMERRIYNEEEMPKKHTEAPEELGRAILEYIKVAHPGPPIPDNEVRDAAATLLCFGRGRNWCKTKEGYIGWVPFATNKDDLVAVFNGQPAPFVIRPAEDGCYKLIGECYIHGIMNGEIMEDARFPQRDIRLI